MKNKPLSPALFACAFSFCTCAFSLFVCAFSFFVAVSCDKADFSELDVTMWPEADGTVIEQGNAVWIEFGAEVRRDIAEKSTTVRSFEGSIPCDTAWEGNRITLSPLEGWKAGVSYTLSCDGLLKTSEGLSFTVDRTVSFFATSSSLPPVLVTWTPADESVVARDAPITLSFSKAISGDNLERYISLSPSCEISVSLADEGKSAIISPAIEWKGLTRYKWSVSADLQDTEGIALKDSYSGYFRTHKDCDPPAAPSTYAVSLADAAVKVGLDQIKSGMGILFEFSEDIDFDTLKKKLDMEPDLALGYRTLGEASIIAFLEEGKWPAGQTYTVTIPKGLADTAGNATTADFEFSFTPAIPYLEITAIDNSPEGPDKTFDTADFKSAVPLKIGISNIDPYDHYFDISLSQAVSEKEAERLVEAISLEAFFPNSTSSPTLVLATLMPAKTLRLRYYDFTLPDAANPYERIYYKFTVAGGSAGFVMDNGSALKEDVTLYFETVVTP